jgi:hypothetical protein
MAKRRKVAPPPRPTSTTVPGIPPIGTSDYRHFLDTYIAGTGTQGDKTYLSRPSVSRWQDAPALPQGNIVNEIARKFNNTNSLGIDSVPRYGSIGGDNLYGSDASGRTTRTNMTLAPAPGSRTKKDGPDPIIIGHELVHANDHQSVNPILTDLTDPFPALNRDRLNPRVWTNLGVLAQTGGAREGPMADFGEFESSVGKIQEKVAPAGAFKPDPTYPGSGYPFNQAYIEREISNVNHPNPYTVPLSGGAGSSPDWPTLFGNIHTAVTTPSGRGGVPNQGFYLSRASEFPAFMSERLTRHWGANSGGADALSLPEARFLHSTLGNMAESYSPANAPAGSPLGTLGYPEISRHIDDRRRSLEHAYYPGTPATAGGVAVPPGVPAGSTFSRGGRVTGKNLLSRFKKTH